jgi:hypothetical protein
MSKEKKTALTVIFAGVAFGAVAFVLNAVLGMTSPRLAHAFALGIVFGNLVFVLGCIQLARAKGQPWFFGLLGLLSCIGLGILWFVVPDKETPPAP